jgi:release factor glutamine methyltransferase
MIIQEALALGARRLSICSSTPRLDAEVLLAHALEANRTWLLAHATETLQDEARSAFEALIERRSHGEPVAYLTGHKEFFGLDLVTNNHVLVPRPETESAVEACLEALPADAPSMFADIGTGSGAIVVAVGVNRPQSRLFGTEISPEALVVARANCARHGLKERADLRLGDLFEPLSGLVFDVIAANLPYVPPGEAAPDVATWEPQVAVFGGGDDGTAVIRRFLAQAPAYIKPNGTIVMETAHSQGPLVSNLASKAFPGASVIVRKDLAGYDRIVIINL